jgi:hypothetical protein
MRRDALGVDHGFIRRYTQMPVLLVDTSEGTEVRPERRARSFIAERLIKHQPTVYPIEGSTKAVSSDPLFKHESLPRRRHKGSHCRVHR